LDLVLVDKVIFLFVQPLFHPLISPQLLLKVTWLFDCFLYLQNNVSDVLVIFFLILISGVYFILNYRPDQLEVLNDFSKTNAVINQAPIIKHNAPCKAHHQETHLHCLGHHRVPLRSDYTFLAV